MKRGQVAYFAIAGLFLVILFILVYYLVQGGESLSILDVDADFVEPVGIIQECFEQSADNSISYVLASGGYFKIPGNKILIETDNKEFLDSLKQIEAASVIELNYGAIPVWLLGIQDLSPVKRDFEKGFEEYVKEMAPLCMVGVDRESMLNNLEVVWPEMEVSAKVNEKNILFKIDYPVQLVKKDVKYVLPEFSFLVEKEVGSLIESAYSVKEIFKSDINVLNIREFREVGANVVFYPYDNKNIIFEVSDDKEKIVFAARN